MIPKAELAEVVMALDFFDDSFGIGEELDSWKQKKREDLEQQEYPFVFDEDIPKLIKYFEACIEQLKSKA
jgi:hypothetical protein